MQSHHCMHMPVCSSKSQQPIATKLAPSSSLQRKICSKVVFEGVPTIKTPLWNISGNMQSHHCMNIPVCCSRSQQPITTKLALSSSLQRKICSKVNFEGVLTFKTPLWNISGSMQSHHCMHIPVCSSRSQQPIATKLALSSSLQRKICSKVVFEGVPTLKAPLSNISGNMQSHHCMHIPVCCSTSQQPIATKLALSRSLQRKICSKVVFEGVPTLKAPLSNISGNMQSHHCMHIPVCCSTSQQPIATKLALSRSLQRKICSKVVFEGVPTFKTPLWNISGNMQ